ncbi:HpcH/HpaI aldolase/citrate lyase family protein [uncultured Helicobacter sp.]|uniref:HpcH/HpaI aldolase/citrate lyase family protein n=1 Tax=uncultured Helicobacter sp. TaxID=175537 RepID=UPI001C39B740|nr:CoA ester lyase [Candidatus Helicobacter avicola]
MRDLSTTQDFPHAKSLLFVATTRKEEFANAFKSEADAIILDLEDSVPSERKNEGRANILEFCQANPSEKFFVRINDTQSAFFADDMAFLKQLGLEQLHGIMLPKAEQRAHIESVISALGEIPLLLLVESALGVQNLNVTASHPCVKQLAFGAFDMILDLGLRDGEGKDFMLNFVRVQMALASKIYNLLPPINRVFPNTRDDSRLKANMESAYSMGFGGSLTFYPNQLAIINAVFSQGSTQIQWAKEVLRLAKIHKGEPFSFEGNVVDIPMIKKAQGILERKY